MDRRAFLTRLATMTGAATFSSTLFAHAENAGTAFNTARARNPLLAGFDNAPGDLDFAALSVEGEMPEGLAGVFYRNGPGQHSLGGERYHHWFDGDGYLHRWQIGGGKVGFKGRFAPTPKRQAEQAAGQFLFSAGGGGIPARESIGGPDAVNVANTNILPVGGELWALWEGGSALRLDPVTLESRGFVALNEDFEGAPFSAHPRRGEDGRIWNIGSFGDKLALYRLKADGALDAAKVHAIPPVGIIHDFLLTEKSVVVVLGSTRVEGKMSDGYFGAIKGRPDLPMQVKVYDRETLALTREHELPAGYVFHFGNAHEDGDGTIVFDMVFSKDTDNLQSLRAPMRGEMPVTDSLAQLVTLTKTGAPKRETLRSAVEFPRINPGRNARRHRFVFTAAQAVPGKSLWFDSVAKLDLETGKQSLAIYGADWMVEEHVFIPRPGGRHEDGGWIIGTALNWKTQKTALSVFDARRMDDGPVARVSLDVALPLGFHGQFVGG